MVYLISLHDEAKKLKFECSLKFSFVQWRIKKFFWVWQIQKQKKRI